VELKERATGWLRRSRTKLKQGSKPGPGRVLEEPACGSCWRIELRQPKPIAPEWRHEHPAPSSNPAATAVKTTAVGRSTWNGSAVAAAANVPPGWFC